MKPTELQARTPIVLPITLSARDLAAMGDALPAAEPILAIPPPESGRRAPLRVCEPLLDGNEARYLSECIAENWISSSGPFVHRFEAAFASAVGTSTGIATSSGTTALHLAVAALGIGPGDEVVVPTFTMIASANAVAYTGATPIFADSEGAHWNLSPSAFAAAITPRTRAVIVVHAYGHPAEMDEILAIARPRGIAVIEDAAEAHGAQYRGRPVGSLGDIAAFSFYANKIVSTGEGGMLTTNDTELGAVARRLRDHAFSPERHFWHEYRGFSYRMTNLQAAVGLAQTERLDEFVARKRANRAAYDAMLRTIPGLRLPGEANDVRSVFWMYLILVAPESGTTRDGLRAALAARGIETRTAFVPMHLQPIYHEAWRDVRFPVAEEVGRRGLYLPSGLGLQPDDIAFVAGEVARAAAV
jgi:perosamine synthetase